MSAREKLYLSHIGQSVKDNTEIPPSIVLDTLMDYLGLQAGKHPLHGFSNRYNNTELFTYLYNTEPDPNVHKTKETVTSSNAEKSEAPKEEIWANDFVKFFEAPIDWYFNKVLGIKYDGNEDDTLPETELFDLDHLQKWQIKDELLKYKGDSDEELEAFIQKHIKKGKLPLKNLGRETVEKYLEEIKPLKERYLELTNEKDEKSVAIDLVVDGFRITGTIDGVFDGEYIQVSTSTSGNVDKYKVRAYLKALLLYASGKITSARLLALRKYNNNTTLVEVPYPNIDQETARKNLIELSNYLMKGKNQPLLFCLKARTPQTGEEEITVQSVMKAFKKETEDKTYIEPPIRGNKYIAKLLDEECFESLNQENLEEIKTLAGLLNL